MNVDELFNSLPRQEKSFVPSPVFFASSLAQLLSHIVAHQLDVESLLSHLDAST